MLLKITKGTLLSSVSIVNAGANNGTYYQTFGAMLSQGDSVPAEFILPDGTTAKTQPEDPADPTAYYKQNGVTNDLEIEVQHVRVYDDENSCIFLKLS